MNRILLIDDDFDDAGIFREALEEVDPGIVFQYFSDGAEAMQDLDRLEELLPDLIFLDINMPTISGWECLGEFKKKEPLNGVPVIIYTTSSQRQEVEKAKALGASAFITKPNDFKILKSVLAAIVSSPSGRLTETLRNIHHLSD